jgi:DNA polymerase IIIc chi subunit
MERATIKKIKATTSNKQQATSNKQQWSILSKSFLPSFTHMSSSSQKERETPFLIALISGGIAGTCVDVALFPIDVGTLQS